jgi:hypothetical protein
LTPTYLIQLGSGGLTGIPFSQLQGDSGSVGALPNVVSLFPSSSSSGGSSVEVAATMPQGSGVDCWRINLVDDSITQTCHVPLGSLLLSSGENFPIVSLLYGNGWWVAIGAGSTPYGGGGPTAAGTSSSVGTSACFSGCQSDAGLVAYYYTEDPILAPASMTWLAALLAGLGALWLFLVLGARRFMRTLSPPGAGAESPPPGAMPGGPGPSQVRSSYLKGLLLWGIVWLPLALMTFTPASGGSGIWLPVLIVAGGLLGVLFVIPFHSWVRKTLHNYRVGSSLGSGSIGAMPVPGLGPWDPFLITSYFAQASWGATFFLLIGVWILALTSRSSYYVMSSTGGSPALSPAAIFVVIMVVAVAGLRALYHAGLAVAVEGFWPRSSSSSISVRGENATTWPASRVGLAASDRLEPLPRGLDLPTRDPSRSGPPGRLLWQVGVGSGGLGLRGHVIGSPTLSGSGAA